MVAPEEPFRYDTNTIVAVSLLHGRHTTEDAIDILNKNTPSEGCGVIKFNKVFLDTIWAFVDEEQPRWKEFVLSLNGDDPRVKDGIFRLERGIMTGLSHRHDNVTFESLMDAWETLTNLKRLALRVNDMHTLRWLLYNADDKDTYRHPKKREAVKEPTSSHFHESGRSHQGPPSFQSAYNAAYSKTLRAEKSKNPKVIEDSKNSDEKRQALVQRIADKTRSLMMETMYAEYPTIEREVFKDLDDGLVEIVMKLARAEEDLQPRATSTKTGKLGISQGPRYVRTKGRPAQTEGAIPHSFEHLVVTTGPRGYHLQVRCKHCGISPHEIEEEEQLDNEKLAHKEEASQHSFVECVARNSEGEHHTSHRCKDCGLSPDDDAETKQKERGETHHGSTSCEDCGLRPEDIGEAE